MRHVNKIAIDIGKCAMIVAKRLAKHPMSRVTLVFQIAANNGAIVLNIQYIAKPATSHTHHHVV